MVLAALVLGAALNPGGILAWLIVGLIAGFLASLVMRGGGYGIVGDIIVGIIGAFTGGLLVDLLSPGASFGFWGSVVVAFIGAIILIATLRMVTHMPGKREREEAERRIREQEEVERRGRMRAEAERRAREQEEVERRAKMRAETERRAREPTQEAQTNSASQQLGNYRLLRLLGQGGFAEVYLGEHIYLQTKAAIKVLHTQLAQNDNEGFLREARTIANLKHPHIVRILDFGVDRAIPFLIMEYAPGGTLRQRHPRGTRLPLSTVVSYVRQVAEALQYAHDHKLIHRDIKPENMLVGEQLEVLLSDFGIAVIAQSTRYDQTRDTTGTATYMAPEQFRGKPLPASDQYSLAITTYEWLSGTPPFTEGDFIQLGYQHAFEPVPALKERAPRISPEVEQVVMKAVAKDPQQRFGTVHAFAAALEQASLA